MFHRPHSSALLALAMSSTLSVCAFAAPTSTTITISSDTNMTATQSLGNGDILNITAGTTLSNSTVETVTAPDNKAHTFTINNEGSILQTNSTPGSKKRAIKADKKYDSGKGGTINNGSSIGSSALIQASNEDAIRLGSYVILNNYGTIQSIGAVNTKDRDGTHDNISAYDGVAIDSERKNSTINNYGTIIGPRHGIDIGEKSGRTENETHTITNFESGTIIGKNGSGIGSDGDGVVTNYGLISGRYAGAGNIFTGNDPTSLNGDGDGVDIDGIASITNYGRIEGLGAGGVDSDGNPNGADGIAAGGGTIINHAGATIYGQSKGILIDDGANGTTAYVRGTADAAGAAVAITNSGTITAEKKTAIGLVGDYADTIINNTTGVITGGKDSVRVDALASTTAAAAVQMGGGNDTLTNYGTIEGKNNMAIDMGEGDDTLNLLGGSVIGSISGGSGTNSLLLGGTQHYAKSTITNFQNLTTQDSALIETEIKESTTPLPFNGTVILGNGTSIQPVVKGKIADGSSHTIISAASLTADTAHLNIVDTSATFDFTLETSGNNLNVIAERVINLKDISDTKLGSFANSLETMGNTSNTVAIAEALNSMGTDQEVSDAIKQLSPDISHAALNAVLVSQDKLFGALSTRMGMNHIALGSLPSGLAAGDNENTFGWIEIIGSSAKQKARKGADGYEIHSGGIAAGHEWELHTNELFGISGGFTHINSSGVDAAQGDTTQIDSFHAGLYYSRSESQFTFDTALVGSLNNYDAKRSVDVSGITQTLTSKYKGYTLGLMGEVGYPIAVNTYSSLRPLTGLQYSYNQSQSYDEAGGSAALHVENQTYSSIKGVIGAEYSQRLNPKSGYTVSLRYLREFASTPTTTAGFIGEGTTFSVSGIEPSRNELQIGTGYELLNSEGKTLSIGYDAAIKEKYLSHQLTLKMVF